MSLTQEKSILSEENIFAELFIINDTELVNISHFCNYLFSKHARYAGLEYDGKYK